MKSLIRTLIKKLRCKNGETLVEAIVSILLLAILLATVTAMISTSLRMTANSMRDAVDIQEGLLNRAILGELPDPDLFPDASHQRVTFTIGSTTPLISAVHNIDVLDTTENIIAFYPFDPGSPGEPDETIDP